MAGVADRHHPAARGGGTHQRGRVGPAAHRLLGGPQVGPTEQQPGVEQQHGGVPATRDRLGARGRHDHGTLVVARSASTWPLEDDCRTVTPGSARPISSAVRASPSTGARSPCPPHSGQVHPAATGRAPGAHRRPVARGDAQRAVADRAVGRRAAVVARQPGRVADSRRLHQHRPGATPSRSSRSASRGSREWAAGSRPVAARRRRRPTRSRTVARGAWTSLAQPVRTRYSASTLRAWAASTAAQPVWLGAQEQHLAGVGVRRPRLVEEVVAVVPDRHQAEVVHRREGGGAGADDHAHGPASYGQEGGVALGRARVGAEHDVAALAQAVGQGGVEPGHVAVVGSADQRAAPAGDGRDDGLGEQVGPVVAGQHRPHRPRRAALAPARRAAASPPSYAAADSAARSAVSRWRSAPTAASRWWRGAAGRRAAARRSGCRRSARPPAAVSSAIVGGEHRLGTDHAPQGLQRAGVLGGRRRARSRTRRRPGRRSAP